MAIWQRPFSLEEVNALNRGNLAEHLDIVFVDIGEDSLTATMPVDHRTTQPMGVLHGGASAALAETVGSIGANLCIDIKTRLGVGQELNANHLRPVPGGLVTATGRPLHLGRTSHVWDIRIEDDRGRLACVARLTVAIRRR